jgi:hypothetical protein
MRATASRPLEAPAPTPRATLRTVHQPRVGKWWGPIAALLVALAWAAAPVAGFQTSLAILTILGYFAIVVGLYSPPLGLLGVTVLCVLDAPARVFLLTGGLLRWNTFNYWLLLVIAVFTPFFVRLRDRHSITLFLFVSLLGIDLTISPSPALGIQHLLGIIIIFGLLVYFVRAGHDRRMWFWISVAGGLTGALGGLFYFMQRLHLPRINENAWAMFPLTALFAICLGFPSAVSLRRGQPTLMVLATVNLAWVFLSGSRGSLLIGVCCLIVLLLTMRGLRQRTAAIASAGLIAIAAAAHFAKLQDRAMFRIVKLFTTDQPLAGNYSLSSRTSGRSDLAIGGWYIFEEHPFGVGTGGFSVAWQNLDRFDNMTRFGRGEMKAAHSGWVKTLAENGAPGVILLTAYVFSFAFAALRTKNLALRRLGFLTTLALGSALLSTEFQAKGLWYLAAGATAFLQQGRVEAAMRRRVSVPPLRPAPRSDPPTRGDR